MKTFILSLGLCLISIALEGQDEKPFYKAWQIKLESLPVFYNYPRLGLGVEKKFEHYSINISLHRGYDLAQRSHRDDPSDYYDYYGVQAGMKWIFPDAIGEYFVGGKLVFDKSKKHYSQDVFYDIGRKIATLYDAAYYKRSRLGLILDTGYEFYLGKRFSVELSAGLGVISIQNGYYGILNPFELQDVEPRSRQRKFSHKYVEDVWRPVMSGTLKLGWRI
ncbi:MAG: DUF3575 domain-containing protein [Bacteroidota bacterium]|nr:DUF3575 domain-containing protein [Bacteroidota bacterium]